MKIKFALIWWLLVPVFAFAQELAPIVKYSPATYNAGNQNWMISQDAQRFLFFANNEGLLEFNGSAWTLYPSPNETIIRSVKVVGDRVYTGCYMEFGYWTRDANNHLKYHSLSSKIKDKIVDDEQFWNIFSYEQWIIFQSLNQIHIYDTKTGKFSVISPKNLILKSFQANNSIYYQVANEGLYEIENGKGKLVSNHPVAVNNKIVAIFSADDGLLLQTQHNGLFTFINGNFAPFFSDVDDQIITSSVYSCQQLSDKGFAIGTVSNGVFILSANGKLRYHITQYKGLSNNTVLSIFEDADQNLWIGLDNGINCINLQSPIRSYSDNTGSLGTVYASLLHNEKLYIGTNQGLFCKTYNSSEPFQFIKNTKGQVWSLFEYQGTIFCGHDSGTFIIEDVNAIPIFSASGTWGFVKIPGKPDLLLQGNYYGISVLQKAGNQWKFRNKISKFDYSAKHFEISNSRDVYISHEYKGVFRFHLDANFTTCSELTMLTTPKKGKNASLIKFDKNIYYANKQGIYVLDDAQKTFRKDKTLSAVFEKDEYTSGKLIADSSNKLWLFSKNYIHYFTVNKIGNELKKNTIPIPLSLTGSMLGYENVTRLSNSIYLIGTTDGYYTINLNDLRFKSNSVSITNVTINKIDEKLISCPVKSGGEFNYDENNIILNYTVPEYNKYIYTEYQYILEGLQEEWSNWSAKTTANFKNLPPGDYTFKVRAKIANSNPKNLAVYSFTICKPWYATNLALVLYLILCVLLALYIHKAYKEYYRKKEQKLIEENNLLLEIKELENEQQLMKLKNEQLSSDVDSKNRELAVSTMSLMKKNELLALIKDDLNRTGTDKDDKSIKSVINTINKSISDDDSWTIFKEAFNNADNDFLKKIKQLHPSLTPNDLRLCAYLRLNLSSKEIAPLLNISVRSVEVKRYRLRKKMDLPHEKGVVEYILSI
ncbi:LuxR family transcriptional regulator [Flavobacterium sp. MAH-1]|uniref:LuxR family transcriptional regulator n=1 Tax=Flavobacterium agri TaxID=2743471 RepID=A0A7Y8Y151_9FLAO|nr:triple tyrosine motif-containing protein [Flavobacterium agri]NUY80437.1 LuxR family transcriptional regulator [Flavobacterium agri]NYA70462.1 LuxR family transcriptional regulator [Flavobacterium agri]